MAIRKSKVEAESLTDAKIQQVISMLEPSVADVKPCSKKDACSFLGISYNTSRLDSIIKDYKERVALDEAMRARKRGTPATPEEIKHCVKAYLEENMPITSIANSLYRSTSFVNKVLESQGVTFRPASHDYFKPPVISDADARDRFSIGEVVYNARYNVNCIIKEEKPDPKYTYIYKVWLLGEYNQFAYTAFYDLGSLDVLKKVENY